MLPTSWSMYAYAYVWFNLFYRVYHVCNEIANWYKFIHDVLQVWIMDVLLNIYMQLYSNKILVHILVFLSHLYMLECVCVFFFPYKITFIFCYSPFSRWYGNAGARGERKSDEEDLSIEKVYSLLVGSEWVRPNG